MLLISGAAAAPIFESFMPLDNCLGKVNVLEMLNIPFSGKTYSAVCGITTLGFPYCKARAL